MGNAWGLVGTALGAVSVKLQSPGLFIVSTFFFGMSVGMSFALRFAAAEVVPSHWASRSVTLVVSGGVIAAFVGPELSAVTRDMFHDDSLIYMGIFLMTGSFHMCAMICIAFVNFSDTGKGSSASAKSPPLTLGELQDLLASRHFAFPILTAVVGWAAMVMPMSLVRVVMDQLDFSTTESLRVIELHFLGMYLPGFFTGTLIQCLGHKMVCYLSVLVFAVGETIGFFPDEENDSILLWSLSLICVGVAWNLAFTASTVRLMQKGRKENKANRQAANDSLMFLLAGAGLFASSYIFKAGGSELDGWHTLNWVVVGLLGFLTVLLGFDLWLDCSVEASDEGLET